MTKTKLKKTKLYYTLSTYFEKQLDKSMLMDLMVKHKEKKYVLSALVKALNNKSLSNLSEFNRETVSGSPGHKSITEIAADHYRQQKQSIGPGSFYYELLDTDFVYYRRLEGGGVEPWYVQGKVIRDPNHEKEWHRFKRKVAQSDKLLFLDYSAKQHRIAKEMQETIRKRKWFDYYKQKEIFEEELRDSLIELNESYEKGELDQSEYNESCRNARLVFRKKVDESKPLNGK